jgi:hypothetical protein
MNQNGCDLIALADHRPEMIAMYGQERRMFLRD